MLTTMMAASLVLGQVPTDPLGALGVSTGVLPSFDCAAATSEAERLVCTDPDLATLDLRLAERHAAALAGAQSLDVSPDAAVAEIEAERRAWVEARDACPSGEALRPCVEDAYLRREGHLVAQWMLEAPRATAEFVCDGNPANSVWIGYYDTELPSIRIEYGDSVETATLSPAGSGSRYDTASGRFFWQKGDAAIFAWDGGTEMSCVLAK